MLRHVFATPPISNFVTVEIEPGFDVVPENATDAQWEQWIIDTYVTFFHPIGTVAMLPKEFGGAVDSNMLVYGTTNVRVIGKFNSISFWLEILSVVKDASTIPIEVSANTQGTVYGVAEKVSSITSKERKS